MPKIHSHYTRSPDGRHFKVPLTSSSVREQVQIILAQKWDEFIRDFDAPAEAPPPCASPRKPPRSPRTAEPPVETGPLIGSASLFPVVPETTRLSANPEIMGAATEPPEMEHQPKNEDTIEGGGLDKQKTEPHEFEKSRKEASVGSGAPRSSAQEVFDPVEPFPAEGVVIYSARTEVPPNGQPLPIFNPPCEKPPTDSAGNSETDAPAAEVTTPRASKGGFFRTARAWLRGAKSPTAEEREGVVRAGFGLNPTADQGVSEESIEAQMKAVIAELKTVFSASESADVADPELVCEEGKKRIEECSPVGSADDAPLADVTVSAAADIAAGDAALKPKTPLATEVAPAEVGRADVSEVVDDGSAGSRDVISVVHNEEEADRAASVRMVVSGSGEGRVEEAAEQQKEFPVNANPNALTETADAENGNGFGEARPQTEEPILPLESAGETVEEPRDVKVAPTVKAQNEAVLPGEEGSAAKAAAQTVEGKELPKNPEEVPGAESETCAGKTEKPVAAEVASPKEVWEEVMAPEAEVKQKLAFGDSGNTARVLEVKDSLSDESWTALNAPTPQTGESKQTEMSTDSPTHEASHGVEATFNLTQGSVTLFDTGVVATGGGVAVTEKITLSQNPVFDTEEEWGTVIPDVRPTGNARRPSLEPIDANRAPFSATDRGGLPPEGRLFRSEDGFQDENGFGVAKEGATSLSLDSARVNGEKLGIRNSFEKDDQQKISRHSAPALMTLIPAALSARPPIRWGSKLSIDAAQAEKEGADAAAAASPRFGGASEARAASARAAAMQFATLQEELADLRAHKERLEAEKGAMERRWKASSQVGSSRIPVFHIRSVPFRSVPFLIPFLVYRCSAAVSMLLVLHKNKIPMIWFHFPL